MISSATPSAVLFRYFLVEFLVVCVFQNKTNQFILKIRWLNLLRSDFLHLKSFPGVFQGGNIENVLLKCGRCWTIWKNGNVW